MTPTFQLDLESVKTNQHDKYLGQRSFRSRVIFGTHRHTHAGLIALYLNHQSN